MDRSDTCPRLIIVSGLPVLDGAPLKGPNGMRGRAVVVRSPRKMQGGALSGLFSLLSITICALALSNCSSEDRSTYATIKGDPQSRAHVLSDSSTVQAIAAQALVAKQEYEFARSEKRPGTEERYQELIQKLANDMGREPGYDVPGGARFKILTDGQVLPYAWVEFVGPPLKGQRAWVPRYSFDDPRESMP
jgi:hypothetical protein